MDPVAVLFHQLPGLLPTAPWHWKGLGIVGKAEPWKPAMGHRVTMAQTVGKHLFFFFFLSPESSWKKIWIALCKIMYSIVKSGIRNGDVTLLFSITRKIYLILEVVLSQEII